MVVATSRTGRCYSTADRALVPPLTRRLPTRATPPPLTPLTLLPVARGTRRSLSSPRGRQIAASAACAGRRERRLRVGPACPAPAAPQPPPPTPRARARCTTGRSAAASPVHRGMGKWASRHRRRVHGALPAPLSLPRPSRTLAPPLKLTHAHRRSHARLLVVRPRLLCAPGLRDAAEVGRGSVGPVMGGRLDGFSTCMHVHGDTYTRSRYLKSRRRFGSAWLRRRQQRWRRSAQRLSPLRRRWTSVGSSGRRLAGRPSTSTSGRRS